MFPTSRHLIFFFISSRDSNGPILLLSQIDALSIESVFNDLLQALMDICESKLDKLPNDRLAVFHVKYIQHIVSCTKVEYHRRGTTREDDITIFLTKNGDRKLVFGLCFTQSCFTESEQSCNGGIGCAWYLNAMIACLATKENASRKDKCCLLGLGGGVLLNVVKEYLSDIAAVLDAVEVDLHVAQAAFRFFGVEGNLSTVENPSKSPGKPNVHIRNAFDFMLSCHADTYDVIFVDLYSKLFLSKTI